MTISFGLAHVVIGALTVLAAVAVGPTPARKAVAVGLAAPVTFVSLFVPDVPPIFRSLMSMLGALVFARTLDLVRDKKQYGLLFRLWFMTAIFDARRVRRVRPEPNITRVAIILGYGSLFILSFWLLSLGILGGGLRWLVGAVNVYVMVDMAAALLALVYSSFGFEYDPIHRSPILSRTVQEFWGERWNLAVRAILNDHLFRPLARLRMPRAALFAAFVASALLHFWVTFVAVGLVLSLWMGLFFVVQGLVILAERWLRVARWPDLFARTWTVVMVLGASPLFVEPYLQVLGF